MLPLYRPTVSFHETQDRLLKFVANQERHCQATTEPIFLRALFPCTFLLPQGILMCTVLDRLRAQSDAIQDLAREFGANAKEQHVRSQV
jgi:hypothetical protein